MSKRIRPIRRFRSTTTGFAAPPTVPPNNAELKVARSLVVVVIEPGAAPPTQLVTVAQLASTPLSPSQVWLPAEAEPEAQSEAQTMSEERERGENVAQSEHR